MVTGDVHGGAVQEVAVCTFSSDGPDGERADAEDFDPVYGLEVEVVVYELE